MRLARNPPRVGGWSNFRAPTARQATAGREGMGRIEYRKLCPKSGHLLSREEREVLRARESATGRLRELPCTVCGRVVKVRAHPGTRLFLLYPLHMKKDA